MIAVKYMSFGGWRPWTRTERCFGYGGWRAPCKSAVGLEHVAAGGGIVEDLGDGRTQPHLGIKIVKRLELGLELFFLRVGAIGPSSIPEMASRSAFGRIRPREGSLPRKP